MPRFEARFSNGAWKLFDTIEYTDVDIFGRKKDLDIVVARLNAPKKDRRDRG